MSAHQNIQHTCQCDKPGIIFEVKPVLGSFYPAAVQQPALQKIAQVLFQKNIATPKSKVKIRKAGGGYLIEIREAPIDQIYAVTEDELKQIVFYGAAILKNSQLI